MKKIRQDFHFIMTKAWTFTSKPVLRLWERACLAGRQVTNNHISRHNDFKYIQNFTGMNYEIRKIFFKTIFPAVMLCFLFSCENDIKTINTVGNKDYLPVETAKDVETIYSDSGQIVVIVKAEQLNRYESEKPYVEMPKGVNVFFYDSAMNVKSKLTAKYAISYEKEKIMEAKNDVVVVNEKQEQLNTEHLVWDQKKAIIYSDKFVKINTGTEILWGDGLDADERFDKWKIKKPKGSITINEDE